MTVPSDYSGRLVDVLAFDRNSAAGDELLQIVLAQPLQGGKIVSGIQKLVQRYLLELLTEYGSMPYAYERGTSFLYEARSGLFSTQIDVLGAFARANSLIAENLRNDATDTDPEDELFDSAAVDSIVFSPGKVTIYATILSKAGTSRQILLPLPVTI